jgi:diaminohydroxyphosphoribosylaminopyrimidine deaminase/5-amino-6-(5-phosphoribosylamino)uracil reductase
MHKLDEKFMSRAIELALLGKATTSPNPVVGCVITRDDLIIGEGWHQQSGLPHAEVNAVNSVKNQDLLKEATVYVTLEPCAHYGKTPPCADLLVEKQVKKVVIGCTDPNPLVAGKGIAKLEEAGIQVVLNCLKDRCLSINEGFFHSIKYAQPYVILKWAQTADGYVARENFDSKWISSTQSRQIVHKWRSELDAILVGKNTAHYDNPSLTTRAWSGKNPLRVIVDHKLALNSDLHIFDNSVSTVIYNLLDNKEIGTIKYVKLEEEEFFHHLLADLDKRNIRTLFVEGGASTLKQFIDKDLWNEARVFTSQTTFDGGVKAPQLNDRLLVGSQQIETDILNYFKKIE